MSKQSNPKIISILNMKGGVGKTTLSVNISYILSHFHQKRVLLIDIDPQFNATQYLVDQDQIVEYFQNKKTIVDIIMPKKEEEIDLVGRGKRKKAPPQKLSDFIINISERFDIIPSSLSLIEIENSERGAEHRLKNFIKNFCKHYDIIIIDCPPTLGIHTLSAFLASEYYLIPIKPDNLSSLGLPLLERALERYKDNHSHRLKSLGQVFTIVDLRPSLTFEVMKDIKATGRPCLTAYSSQSTQIAESVSNIVEFYSKSGRYQTEFKDIVAEILAKL